MNDNHDDLERLLAQARPQADRRFEQNLEAKLLAALQEKNERKIKMNGTLRLHSPFPIGETTAQGQRPPIRISITLVAAVMVVIFMAGILYLFSHQENLGAGANRQRSTATPSAQACMVQGNLPIYPVQPGDTLPGIAAQFNMPIDALTQANCLTPNTVIVAGQVLFLPYTGDILPPIASATFVPEANPQIPTGTAFPMEMQPTVVPPMVVTATPTLIPADGQFSTISTVFPTFVPTAFPSAYGVILEVVVALQDIPEGETITETMVGKVFWPVAILPPDTLETFDAVIGKTATADIAQWMPIMGEQVE